MREWLRELGVHWLLLMWRNPLPFLGVALLGGACSFAYSYVPLHGSKDWQIDYLQRRVDAQNRELRELEIALSTARSDAASRPEAGAVSDLEKDLRQAESQLAKLESKARRDEATIQSLRKTRDQWKQKYEDAAHERDEALAAARAPAPSPPASATPKALAPAASEPAPAPRAEPVAKPAPLPDGPGPAAAEWDAPVTDH